MGVNSRHIGKSNAVDYTVIWLIHFCRYNAEREDGGKPTDVCPNKYDFFYEFTLLAIDVCKSPNP